MAFLEQRDRQPELMDQPGLDESAHHAALRGLRRVNWLSGGVPAIWRELQPLVQFGSQDCPLRVLDVACGGGDVVLRLARQARNSKLPIRFDGCDLSETAVRLGCQTAQDQGILDVRFFQHDALHQPFPEGYDVIMCSLFLHHLEKSDAVLLLKSMAKSASRAILVDDLVRTRWGYMLCWIGCRVLSRSPIVHNDGPLSVRAAFTLDEARSLAEEAALANVQFRQHWPERFLLSWSRG